MKFTALFVFAVLAPVPQSTPHATTPHATTPPQTAPVPQPAPPAPAASSAEPSAPLPPPWDGTLADGLAEVRKLARANQLDAASALCERLLAPGEFARWRESLDAEGGWKRALTRALEPAFDVLGLSDRTAPERAEVLYAAGVVSVTAEQRARGEDEFGRAQSLAGPGALRLESGYQLGTSALLDGESWRAQIPEIQAKSGAAPGAPARPPAANAPAANGAAPGQEPPPDPLAQARTAYLRARERFVERLRADWRDADTRANTELVLRRLKELDELEQQRKEQQQKNEQDKQKQDPNQPKSDPDKDPQKQDEQQKDKSQQNPPDKQDENAKQNEPPKPDEPKPDDAQAKQEPPKPDEKKPGEQQDPAQMDEKQLTKEEMMRLLDILDQREEQWKKLQQQLQQRRPRAKKDW